MDEILAGTFALLAVSPHSTVEAERIERCGKHDEPRCDPCPLPRKAFHCADGDNDECYQEWVWVVREVPAA